MADESALRRRLRKITGSWATRSLAIGAIATVIDLGIGTALLSVAGLPTRGAAMIGTAFGATFTFFANRYFAFREHNPKLTSPALKFLLATALSSVVHGQVVVMLREWAGVPYVPAKILADLAVFTFGQLLLLRYVVFPHKKPAPPVATDDAETPAPTRSSS